MALMNGNWEQDQGGDHYPPENYNCRGKVNYRDSDE
jgi:hypothetical protein